MNIDNDRQYGRPVENLSVECGWPEPQNTASVNNLRAAGSMRVRCMQMIDLNEPHLVFLVRNYLAPEQVKRALHKVAFSNFS
jgi:hypothetical protein